MVYWLEYRARNFQVAGSNLTAGHLQATLSKLLTYRVLRSASYTSRDGKWVVAYMSYGVKA